MSVSGGEPRRAGATSEPDVAVLTGARAEVAVFGLVALAVVGQGLLFVFGFDQLRPPSPDVGQARQAAFFSLAAGLGALLFLGWRLRQPVRDHPTFALLPLTTLAIGVGVGVVSAVEMEVQSGGCEFLCFAWFDVLYLLPVLAAAVVGAGLGGLACLYEGSAGEQEGAPIRRWLLIGVGTLGLVLAASLILVWGAAESELVGYAYLAALGAVFLSEGALLASWGSPPPAGVWRSVALSFVGFHAALAVRLLQGAPSLAA